jgi:uncharacterized repeat protein (TIGR03847 family)
MPRFEIDLNPLEHITVDAIGQPGTRVFYIQGWRATDPQPVTIIIEKVQLQSLALGVDQMLAELAKQKPELAVPAAEYDADKMRITPPLDPLFRAGDMGLGYDAGRARRSPLLVHAGPDPPPGGLEQGSDQPRAAHLSAVRAANGT